MTIEEVLTTLKEDYALRASMHRKNLRVQDELEDEIDDLEQSYISCHVMPKLEAYAKELLKDIECELLLAMKKDGHGEITVTDEYAGGGITPHMVAEETPAIEESSLSDTSSSAILLTRDNRQEAEGRHLRITFPDGVIYEGKNSKDTFINALKKIGLHHIPEVGIMCAGYNLVDSRQRNDGNRTWQEKVDDKWIYIYFSNPTKVDYLLRIAEFHKLNLTIEAV